MKKSLLHNALALAVEKKDNHRERRFIHFSFVIQDNQIVECGRNSIGCPPKHFGYDKKCADITYRPKLHSEVNAYRKARGLLENEPFEIINVRLNKHGVMRNSKPCICCYTLLKELGCIRFYYSSDIGFLTCI